MNIVEYNISILKQLDQILDSLNFLDYNKPLEVFDGHTISQHARHILEFYECLFAVNEGESLNYDNRKRNLALEQDLELAKKIGKKYISLLENTDSTKSLFLESNFGGKTCSTQSNFSRELVYLAEHSVHHFAMIKIGLKSCDCNKVPENFGVAASTIKYKKG